MCGIWRLCFLLLDHACKLFSDRRFKTTLTKYRYMRPNTPHYVLTPEAAICYGGHFYATSTIRETVFGVFHMFALSKAITNTEHSRDSRLLLRRLIVYIHHVLVRGQLRPHPSSKLPHIPSVWTFDGALDLFLLCIFAELGELLDPVAYAKQHRDDRELEHERLSTIYARGLARELLEWWNALFMFSAKNDQSLTQGKGIFRRFLAHQVRALAAYKKLAEEKEMEAEEPACTAAAFEALAKKYFPTLDGVSSPKGTSLNNFDWLKPGYIVVKAPTTTQIDKASPSEQ